MEVVWDQQDGHRAEYSLNGWVIERIATVKGVTGTGTQRLWNAASASGLPSIGDAHPVFTVARLERGLVEAVASDTVRFRFIYTEAYSLEYQLDTTQIGGGLSQVEEQVDRLGEYQTVTYTFPSDHPYWPSQSLSQRASFMKMVPDHTIYKRRRETVNPAMKAKLYLGAVNNGPWSLDANAASGTWLCTMLKGTSPDGGQTWIVEYSFQYRAATWTVYAHFIDPWTGKMPSDVNDTVNQPLAIKAIELYPIMDFDGLAL
jgi:hypothetical protein